MKFKEYLSKLSWFHKRIWGSRYIVLENNKDNKYILIYHKKIYILDKEKYVI